MWRSYRYNEREAKFQILVVAEQSEDGNANAQTIKAAQDWKAHAFMFGLNAEDLGKKFKYRGQEHTIMGLCPRKRKFPVLVSVGGKQMLFTLETLKLVTLY